MFEAPTSEGRDGLGDGELVARIGHSDHRTSRREVALRARRGARQRASLR
jgi:hypothetical protein